MPMLRIEIVSVERGAIKMLMFTPK
jgi:hypothetical protein